MERLNVECKGYSGELISIKPDLFTTYPDGERNIETFKVKLRSVSGDYVAACGVLPADIKLIVD